MTEVPTRIVEVAQQLKDGEIPRRYKVRAVLKWFGASRRGANVLSDIKTVLENLGLQTDPVIDVAKIDDYLRFVLASPASADTQGPSEQAPQSASVAGPGSTFSSANDGAPNGAVEAASDDQLAPKPEEEQPILKPDDSSRPVTSQSSDWTISVLRDKLDRGQLDLQPKFQREYVWNLRPELPSRLIESLLLEIPIPPIYFGKLKDGRLEMIWACPLG